MALSSLLSGLNPRALAQKGLRAWINHLLGEIGTMTEFSLDLKSGQLRITLDLKGETEPVTLTAHGVSVLEDGRIKVASLTGSREWINVLAQRYVKDRVIDVPEEYRDKIRLLSAVLG